MQPERKTRLVPFEGRRKAHWQLEEKSLIDPEAPQAQATVTLGQSAGLRPAARLELRSVPGACGPGPGRVGPGLRATGEALALPAAAAPLSGWHRG